MFSERIAFERMRQCVTQEDLAFSSGLPKSSISHIESNDVDMRMSTAIRLANALEITLDELATPVSRQEWAELAEKNKKINKHKAKLKQKRIKEYGKRKYLLKKMRESESSNQCSY